MMRSKLAGSVVLAAAILAVVFLLQPWRKEESSDQFVVHRREKRDVSSLESTNKSSKNETTQCTNGTSNCLQTVITAAGTNLTLEETRKFCQQNTTNNIKINCSGKILNSSEYCAKIEGVSKNSSNVLKDCVEVIELVKAINNSSLSNNSTSSVVVKLLVSTSKVLSVSLVTSSKIADSVSSIMLKVLPNKTVAILPKTAPNNNASPATEKEITPSSTVHVNLPPSSTVEVKVVPTTEKVAQSTEKVSQPSTRESTTVKTETTVPVTEPSKPTTPQKVETNPMTHTGTEAKKETTVKTTIHIIKNTVKSPYEEEEQNMRFFMTNVMMPISCGVGAAVLIALTFFMYRRCRRRKLKRVRYFGNRPGEKQFLDRMKLLEESSEEE